MNVNFIPLIQGCQHYWLAFKHLCNYNDKQLAIHHDICRKLEGVTRLKKLSPTCYTVYPKKYAHGFCFAVLCCGYTLTDFPISFRLTSLALWQSNDCPSASKATLMNMDKYFKWIHYERLHNHNKAKHNKTVCIFIGIYCSLTFHAVSYCLWLIDCFPTHSEIDVMKLSCS